MLDAYQISPLGRCCICCRCVHSSSCAHPHGVFPGLAGIIFSNRSWRARNQRYHSSKSMQTAACIHPCIYNLYISVHKFQQAISRVCQVCTSCVGSRDRAVGWVFGCICSVLGASAVQACGHTGHHGMLSSCQTSPPHHCSCHTAALERSGVDSAAVDEVFMGNVCSANVGQVSSRSRSRKRPKPATQLTWTQLAHHCLGCNHCALLIPQMHKCSSWQASMTCGQQGGVH
jgi:hypothetical protein